MGLDSKLREVPADLIARCGVSAIRNRRALLADSV
jgi:hypothetical protein